MRPAIHRLGLPTLLAAVVAAAGCAGPRIGRSLDARVPRAAETTVTDVRTAGPFYERVETSAGDTRVSWRPFLFTRIDAPQDAARVREVFWPVYADRSRAEHFSWRFLLAFGGDFDTRDPNSPHYAWVFPFWFQGTSSTGKPYAALFPIGGVLRDFFTYDRIRFLLFPLWMDTDKKDVHGWSVLWPVFARAEGDGIRRWRVFPLVGAAEKDGEWRRHFILWPLWTHARYLKEPTAGYEWALVPVFGRAERGVESSWYFLPPFFQFTFGHGGKNEGFRRILAPWPFVRIEDTVNRHKRSFWPLFATSWTDQTRNTYVLWPFFQYTSARSGGQVRKDWSLAPVFHRSVLRPLGRSDGMSEEAARPCPRSTYTRLWPLFSSIDRDGRRVVRVPDFSLQRRTGALERNLLHMGTLYTRGAESAPRRVEHDLLWGMFRWGHGEDGYRDLRAWPFFQRSRDPGSGRSGWSVLGGLLGRETSPEGSSRRWFWFRAAPQPLAAGGTGTFAMPPADAD